MDLRHTTVRRERQDARLLASGALGASRPPSGAETVAQLGELDGQGRARARALALRIDGREEQYELFEAPAGERSEPVAVRLDQIRLERARRFGDVWLGWRLWRALALDRFCEGRLVEGRERAPWPADRGMASAENIAWLRSGQRRYVIGASKSELKTFAGQLADRRDWRQVRDGVEAKVCAGPDGSETFLLVRSA